MDSFGRSEYRKENVDLLKAERMQCKLPFLLIPVIFSIGLARAQAEFDAQGLAQRVYQRLERVIGIGMPPELHVQTDREVVQLQPDRRRQERVAFLRSLPGPPRRQQIVIDAKVIRICQELQQGNPDACVAYFLGHELAHYVLHHDWGSDFSMKMAGIKSAQEIAQMDLKENAEHEAQADNYGLLYATIVGYDSLAVAPQALAATYRAYQIPEDLPGYLTLSVRQQIAERSRAFLQLLLPIFDAATLSMTLGRFAAAAALYDAILEQFPSREIYNNAAIARARIATAVDQTNYPWLLDGATRLPRSVRRGNTPDTAERERLLAVARDDLDRALALDRGYAVAYANRGLIALAQQESNRARADFDSARRVANRSAVIIASVEFGEALLTGRDATQPQVTAVAAPVDPTIGRSELWPGRTPKTMRPTHPQRVIISGIVLESAVTSQYRWFSLRFPDEAAPITAIVIDCSTSDAKLPLRVGMNREEWSRLLGAPSAEMTLFPARAYWFQSLGVVVQADEAGRVLQEIIYQ